jgi:hypothetical protein
MILSRLATLIESAIYNRPPPLITNMCQEHYQPYYYLMYLLAGELCEGNIVELGVNKGYGISSFAYGNPSVKVIGLDLNVSPIFCPDNVEFHLMSALPVPDFIEGVAILHIDTEHSYSNALNEFMQYKPYLLPGAVVMFDDLHAMDNGVLRAFYELPYDKIQCDKLHPNNGYGVLVYE